MTGRTDIGLYLSTSDLFPCLCIGVIRANLSWAGYIPLIVL